MTDPLTHAREIVGKMTGAPWRYRPHEFDDWGWIRGPDGYLVARGSAGRHCGLDEEAQHRREGTDPYGHNTAGIILAVSTLRRLTDPQAPERLARVIDPDAWLDHGKMLPKSMAESDTRLRAPSLAKATEYINALLTEET